MIQSDIKDDLHASFMRLLNQKVHILHSAEDGIDLLVVANIVSVAD